ncbi:MAG: AAA family ATPase, partial [Bacteroidota bacterium]
MIAVAVQEKHRMEQLVDFLNHGTLPFIGRGAETERIVEFWRGTYNAQELRAALVVGEAGLGKSRLIAESIPRIADAGGIVIHVRLYPESMASVVPLIARELWYSPHVRGLLKNEPEATISDVTAALRRLARLRPTLLIIDDIHLVEGESLREFSLLLNSLAEETLSLLCTARPVELAARAPLERFLVDQIQLTGLSSVEISSLWTGLLSSTPDPEIVAPLAELTGGNPLALRSALRSAIKNETLVRDAATNSWRSSISPEAFGTAMRRNVGRITEGMVSHLTEEEKSAARTLASLGEIFARETAERVIEDSAAMITILMFKGIIASSDSVIPSLSGNNSRHPLLVFTHSLLHQHLLDTWNGSPTAHASATASALPLYSIVPLQILDRMKREIDLMPDELVELIRRIAGMAIERTMMHDWTGCNEMMAVAESMFATFDDRWNADQRIGLRMRLLDTELNFRVQLADTEEFQTLIARQIALTSGLESETMALYHLLALRFLYATTARRNYE